MTTTRTRRSLSGQSTSHYDRRGYLVYRVSLSFMGGNAFCIKACDPAGANAASYCQHIYDRIGCSYNAPNSAQNGTFEVCDSDNMMFPGQYVENGVTMTYTQPPESLGAITTMPYTASIPASSNCRTFQSADLYTDLAAVTASAASSAASATATASGKSGSSASASKGSSASGTASRSGSASSATVTGASSGASSMGVSLVAGIVGVAFSVVALA